MTNLKIEISRFQAAFAEGAISPAVNGWAIVIRNVEGRFNVLFINRL
jgi:hypothetical protein